MPYRPNRRPTVTRGTALPDVLVATIVLLVAVAVALPSLATVRGDGLVAVSLDNLRVLGIADATYAEDWNDRQWTGINDTIGAYGTSAASGFPTYNQEQGGGSQSAHPPITLGWAPQTNDGPLLFYAYRTQQSGPNASLCQPITFTGFSSILRFGSFRLINDARFTPYIAGRLYDQRFYAPADAVVQPLIEPLLDSPYEFVFTPSVPGFGDAPYWSSYIRSPAAMVDPAVMEGRRLTESGPVGGWVDPWTLDTGFRSPTRSLVRHPGLKTSILEHHWLQGTPKDPCNPEFVIGTYAGCEPYYFNHGVDSAPAALFFDGSTRLLPNTEVMAGDALVQRANGGSGFDGLWSRSTAFGEDGYYNDLAFDNPFVSHHVLTTDGILGRDTLGPGGFDAPAPRTRRPAPARRLLDAAAAIVAPRAPPFYVAPFSAEEAPDPGPHAR